MTSAMQQKPDTPSAPASPKTAASTTEDLPITDLNTFFRILRFLSANPELADLAKAQETVPTEDIEKLAHDSSSSGSPAPLQTRPRTQTGTSLSVSNRIRMPPVLQHPLEEYRMCATNLPIDQPALAHAREQVRSLLERLCAELNDQKVTAALQDTVLASSTGKEAEGETSFLSGSTSELGSSVTSCATIRRPSAFGMNALNEMQEIIPGLWCSSYHPAANLEHLKRHGITHICCCIGTQPRFPGDLMYMTLSADDRADYDMSQHFARSFEFIENALVKCNGGVLVHCGAGISRAPTIVAAYLMRKLRLSSTMAVRVVQQHRACASPNMGFRRQLHDYGVKLGLDESSSDTRGQQASASVATAMAALRSRQPTKAVHQAPVETTKIHAARVVLHKTEASMAEDASA